MLTSELLQTSQADPETARFLTEGERNAILADIPPQQPSMSSKAFDLSQIASLFKNPTFIPFTLIWATHGIGGFGITFVLPTVIDDLGMSSTAISQLLTMVSEHLGGVPASCVSTCTIKRAICRLTKNFISDPLACVLDCLRHPSDAWLSHTHESYDAVGRGAYS